MVSDANTFAGEWWLAYMLIVGGTLRISSRWWICLPIDWFSSLGGKFPDGEESFCVIPEDSTCAGSENWSFSELQFWGDTQNVSMGTLMVFLRLCEECLWRRFFSGCVFLWNLLMRVGKNFVFHIHFPIIRVIVGEERLFWCIRFEWRSFWLTWLVLLLKR